MRRPIELPPFSVELRDAPGMRVDELEAVLLSPQFALFIDALPELIIITDAADEIVAVNQAANPRDHHSQSLRSLPLTSYAKLCDFDMDDLLAAVGRGQVRGVVRGRSSGQIYFAQRRVVLLGTGASAFFVYILRSPEVAEQGKRSAPSKAGSRTPIDEDLLFPPGLQKWVERAQVAYQRGIRVLFLGESGVGKTAVARYLHASMGEAGRPFVHVNCGSIPEPLFESEMFGYERGAFTGALQSGKRGYIESAAGGTLFLDEIGEIPISSQAKLLKFLEDGTIQPVGSAVSKKIETRVMGATNRDLRQMMSAGTFRKDLYFRISTFPLDIPPLRKREDREIILDELLNRIGGRRGVPLSLSDECRKLILNYAFPGNLREMRSVVEYLSVFVDDTAQVSDLPESIIARTPLAPASGQAIDELVSSEGTLKDLTKAFEDIVINRAIQRYGSKREAARRLGVDIATLVRKTTRDRGSSGAS